MVSYTVPAPCLVTRASATSLAAAMTSSPMPLPLISRHHHAGCQVRQHSQVHGTHEVPESPSVPLYPVRPPRRGGRLVMLGGEPAAIIHAIAWVWANMSVVNATHLGRQAP